LAFILINAFMAARVQLKSCFTLTSIIKQSFLITVESKICCIDK
jgi:hypothetical protein